MQTSNLQDEVRLLGEVRFNKLSLECAGLARDPAKVEDQVRLLARAMPRVLASVAEGTAVFDGLPARFKALQWHSYHFELPDGAVPLARNDRCLQGFRAGSAWAIQFHPEVAREDLAVWLDSHNPAEDGPIDIDAFRAENDKRIADWNDFGRMLCGRFLTVAEEAGTTRLDATTRATSPRS